VVLGQTFVEDIYPRLNPNELLNFIPAKPGMPEVIVVLAGALVPLLHNADLRFG